MPTPAERSRNYRRPRKHPQTAVGATRFCRQPVEDCIIRHWRGRRGSGGCERVQVMIRKDGGHWRSVPSPAGIPPPPQIAALESAQRSTCRRRGLKRPGTSSSLIYTFGFRDDGGCADVIEKARSLREMPLFVSVASKPFPRGIVRRPPLSDAGARPCHYSRILRVR